MQKSTCMTCGTAHEGEFCPPHAFLLVKCTCGNEFIMPCDAGFGLSSGMSCGQCGKDNGWSSKQATAEDVKRHWEGYIDPTKENADAK